MTLAEPSTAELSARLLIGGDWLDRASGGTYDHVDPATGQVQATVPLAGPSEVDAAIAAARAALPGWRAVAPAERRDILVGLSLLLREAAAELGEIAGRENGTPCMMAPMAASGLPADWFAYYAGWAEKIAGETIAPSTGNGLDYTVPEPYGVIAVIIPWNAPLVSLSMKVAPALAAGNCVVVKPSELAPFTPARFGELCARAGLPAGVVNIVAGGQEAGDALVRHPGVDKITFTGGLATARRIMTAAAANVTPLLFELGGKSANVVFSDAPLGVAIPTAVMSALAMSGQGCALPTRLLVQESVYDDAVDQIVSMASAIPVGLPADPGTVMGPVVSAGHCARIEEVIAQAEAGSAGKLVAGGKRLGGDLAGGYFIPPTVFADVDPASPLAREEIFGPVLAVLPFRTEDDAVTLANSTPYGLAAYLWTSDVTRAHQLAGRLEAGTVTINSSFPPLVPNVPFGGVRGSGFGREGGEAGLREFVRTKNVLLSFG